MAKIPIEYNNKNAPIGIATEDSKRLGDAVDMGDYDTQVDMFPYTADDHVVTVLRTGELVGTPPYSSGAYVTDGHTAIETLPRIIQRIIYRYAKWRLK